MSPEMLIREQLSSASKGKTGPARGALVWLEQSAKDFWGGVLAVSTEFLTWDRELLESSSHGV